MEAFWDKCLKYLWQANFYYGILAIFLIIVINLIVVFRGLNKGHEVDFLWGLAKFRPSEQIRALQQAYHKLTSEYNTILSVAEQKTNMIKLLGNINREIEGLIQPTLSQDEFDKKFDRVLDFILPGMLSLITRDPDNILRIAVLTKNDEDSLKIYRGYGYSSEGQKHLRLSLHDTIAGEVFLTGKCHYAPDVYKDPAWTPNSKASKAYHSLFCAPIGNERKWDVLSIDATKIDSFNKDDRDCIKYIAQALSVMFEIRDLIKHRGNITIIGGGLMCEGSNKEEGKKTVG